MSWNKKKVAPGSPVDLTLTASSPSLCGIRVVDKSVNLIGGNTDFTQKDITDKKSRYHISAYSPPDLINDYEYCRKSRYN